MTILDKIVAEKRLEVTVLRKRAEEIRGRAAARTDYRDFAAALCGGSRSVATDSEVGHDGAWPSKASVPTLIAEVKKASPSAGVIREDFDSVRIAREYEAAGAAALSVLTDEKFFQGRIDYLERIRAVVKLPLLRKDFIIEELQIHEAAARGADAVLLIVAILDDTQLREFSAIAAHLKLAVLVEVHDEAELDRALGAGAAIIGINNRDLRDFSVRLATTERLTTIIKKNVVTPAEPRPIIVAESGINSRADIERVTKAGVDAVLIGESLMRSGNIAGKVRELFAANDANESE